MSKEHNCPNCGAPIQFNASACPYCDTSYSHSNSVYMHYTDQLKKDTARLMREEAQMSINDTIIRSLHNQV